MDAPIEIPVLYDFASTICFVADRVMARMQPDLDALGLVLAWHPLDLTRIADWSRGEEIAGPRRENALRVARELGVEARMPAVWLDSRRAHAVALSLRGDPREPSWRERVWSAVFEEGRDVGRPGELERLGADLGLDAAALATEDALARLDAETVAWREREVVGAPTFFVAGFPFGGIQEPATMHAFLSRYAERKRAGKAD